MGSEKSKKTRGERPDLRERLCHALDIMPDTLPRGWTVEIRGRNSISIKEGGSILTYTPEKISVKVPRGAVSVVGKRLCCTSYSSGSVGIDGHIDAVFLEED